LQQKFGAFWHKKVEVDDGEEAGEQAHQLRDEPVAVHHMVVIDQD
jgi:hypothetical protein